MSETDDSQDDQKQKLLELLAQNRKIEAIKLHREMTGSGLKEAKDAVEKLGEELAEKYPDQFPKAAKSGCSTMLFVFVLLVVLILIPPG